MTRPESEKRIKLLYIGSPTGQPYHPPSVVKGYRR